MERKNILLTGISKGLGIEIARILLMQGYYVYGLSRSKTENLKLLMSQYPESLFWLSYDLADVDNVNKLIFKEFIGKHTSLHGYVNNAAIAYDDIVTNLNIERLETMYRINVFTPINITKYAIRNMLLNKINGSIVHISSISVHTGYKGLSMYASSKGALEAFSKNVAREWGKLGIRSNCLVAGFMETEMSASLSIEQKNKIYSRTSLKRGTSIQSVAATISFLISDGAESITGQNIFVDSGTL